MNDETVEPQTNAEAQNLTAGMLLRQAREAAGLHVAALAVSMKVPVKKLEALEADRLVDLPDAVFVRALAASVCRTLKIDAAPILSRLPQSTIPKLDTEERGINAPFQAPGARVGESLRVFAARPAVLLVMALLLAAVAVLFFPEPRSTVKSTGSTETVFPPVEVAAAAAPVAPGSAAVVAPVAVAAAPLVSAPAKAEPAVRAASIPVPATPTAAAVPGMVVFKASASAWVRVSDSKGVVVLEKTFAAGETGSASGALPLAVVVGNVAGTSVEVRGQPFALDAVAINNVARFEVK